MIGHDIASVLCFGFLATMHAGCQLLDQGLNPHALLWQASANYSAAREVSNLHNSSDIHTTIIPILQRKTSTGNLADDCTPVGSRGQIWTQEVWLKSSLTHTHWSSTTGCMTSHLITLDFQRNNFNRIDLPFNF